MKIDRGVLRSLFAVVVMLVLFAPSAEAQLRRDKSVMNSLYGSYDISTIKSRNIGEYDFDFDGGFTIGYQRSKRISAATPLYFQVGLEVSYQQYTRPTSDLFHMIDYEVVDAYSNTSYKVNVNGYTEYQFEYTYLSIPIGLMVDLPLGGIMSMQPFAGFNFKIGCSARESTSYRLDDDSRYNINLISDEVEFWDAFEYATGEPQRVEYSYYDEGYMGYGDDWNRFLVGYQVGVNFSFDIISVLFCYEQDLSAISDGCRYRSFSIGAGILF